MCVPICPWKPEENVRCPALTLYLSLLRKDLTLNLEVGWRPGSPRNPPVSALQPQLGLQVHTDHVQLLTQELKIHCPRVLMLAHHALFPSKPPSPSGRCYLVGPAFSCRMKELWKWMLYNNMNVLNVIKLYVSVNMVMIYFTL